LWRVLYRLLRHILDLRFFDWHAALRVDVQRHPVRVDVRRRCDERDPLRLL
jgi:hypothetical protein